MIDSSKELLWTKQLSSLSLKMEQFLLCLLSSLLNSQGMTPLSLQTLCCARTSLPFLQRLGCSRTFLSHPRRQKRFFLLVNV